MKILLLLPFLLSSLAFSSEPTTIDGGWKYEKVVSPVDDSARYLIGKEAESLVFSGFSKTPPTLFFSCDENKDILMAIHWGIPMELSNHLNMTTKITLRADKDTATHEDWRLLNGNGSFVGKMINKDDINSLKGYEKLLIKGNSAIGSSDHTFIDLSGFSEASELLLINCGI